MVESGQKIVLYLLILNFRYDSWNNTWTKLDFELPYDSYYGSAMLVDDKICDM